MTINEQGGEYLRLIQEDKAVELEIASLLAGLRRFALSLAANAKTIQTDAASWNVDADSFCGDIRTFVTNAGRYRELLGQQSDIRATRERYENALVRG